ncbi:MAG TPA: P1 family peptidase [Polyangia bacterium]|jgi:L-aminopeptidase/D-esterase-like protein
MTDLQLTPETTVPGLLVGHAQDDRALTGATAILCPGGATGGYCIRGNAVGARELQPLEPGSLAPQVHGLCLAGGSAFGLDAAAGLVRFLEERGVGFEVRGHRVPIVPGAILFDLWLGDGRVRPGPEMGYAAAQAAAAGPVAEGNVGAGCGATCGKVAGPERAMKSGLGAAGLRTADGLCVFALVAANPFGDILDPATGRPLAGLRDAPDGRDLADAARLLRAGRLDAAAAPAAPVNTTLAVVATNAALDKLAATKVAALAADALPRVIAPACTLYDGDIVFALSCGTARGELHRVGLLARDCLEAAIVRAARAARAAGGLPAAADLPQP